MSAPPPASYGFVDEKDGSLVSQVDSGVVSRQSSAAVFSQVVIDAGLGLLHSPLKLGAGEVAVAVVDRLELAAIDGHKRFREQAKLLAQHHELPTDAADCLAVILAEVGDGLEVRHQTPGQPHQLNVALRLAFKTATGLDAIEVTVDVDLQEVGRMVGGPTCFSRDDALETQLAKVEFIDENIATRTGLVSLTQSSRPSGSKVL